MAQTTTAIGSVSNKVEVSTNGTSWTDLSGSLSVVDPDGQERAIGSAFTFTGDGAVLVYGKLQPVKIKCKGLFTPTTGEAYVVVEAIHATVGGGDIYLRWSPEGGTSGNKRLSTGKAKLSSFKHPTVDAGDENPIPFEFEVTAGTITVTAVPTAE